MPASNQYWRRFGQLSEKNLRPTETSDVEGKGDFCELRWVAVQKVFHKGDIVIVMNDLNTKVGSDITFVRHVMGKYSFNWPAT